MLKIEFFNFDLYTIEMFLYIWTMNKLNIVLYFSVFVPKMYQLKSVKIEGPHGSVVY